jgi:sugar lactone lactonase YvrE
LPVAKLPSLLLIFTIKTILKRYRYVSRVSLNHRVLIAFVLCTAIFIAACTKRAVTPKYSYNSTSTTVPDTSKADSTATFNEPTALAVDASGDIFVADYGNNLIREVSAAGTVTTVAGNGTQGSVNAIAANASFNGPTGLCLDASGNIYIADNNNNQVRMISAGNVTTIAGSDSIGAVDGIGANAYFFGPTGIVNDGNGNLYVTDAGNNLIRKVVPSTGQVSTIAGSTNPSFGNGALLSASFNNPSGIAIDGSGNLYVSDMLNNMIREVNLNSQMVTTVAGSNDTTADVNGPDSTALFYYPTGIAVDASGNIFVAEYVTNVIREINTNGTVTTFAGNGQAGWVDSAGTKAEFNGPSGLAIDKSGNLYVADTYNNVIRKITPAGVVSTVAGNGNAGASNGQALSLRRHSGVHLAIKPAFNRKTLDKIFIKKRRRRK